MFDELSSETLRSVKGGFRIAPEIFNTMMNTLLQATSARDATLHSLNDSVTQMLFMLAARRRHPREPAVAPTGIAPFGSGTPMPFGLPSM